MRAEAVCVTLVIRVVGCVLSSLSVELQRCLLLLLHQSMCPATSLLLWAVLCCPVHDVAAPGQAAVGDAESPATLTIWAASSAGQLGSEAEEEAQHIKAEDEHQHRPALLGHLPQKFSLHFS